MSELDSPEKLKRGPEILPPGQDSPQQRQRASMRFPSTTALVGINVAVFLAMALSGVSIADPTAPDIVKWGGNQAFYTFQGQWWRLITSVFLHIGIIHIAANMWALWNLGALSEMIFGPGLYVTIYCLAGVAGNLASLAWHPGAVGAGASGAIFGMAGAMISVLVLAKLPIQRKALSGTLRSLLFFVVINLGIVGRIPGVDNAAHLGGFVCGLVLGALLSWSRFFSPENRGRARWVSVALVSVLLWAGFLALKRGYRPDGVYRMAEVLSDQGANSYQP